MTRTATKAARTRNLVTPAAATGSAGGARTKPGRRPGAHTAPARPTPEPTPVEPDTLAAAPPRTINGLRVVADEPVLSGLSTGDKQVALRIRQLTLEDRAVVFACQDCPHVDTTRGAIQAHRVEAHPGVAARKAGRPRLAAAIPAEIATMTLAELLELAVQATTWGQLFDQQSAQLAEAKVRAEVAEATVRKLKAALARAGFTLRDDD